MKRNLQFWETKLAEANKEVAQIEQKLSGKPDTTVKKTPAKKTRQLNPVAASDLAPSGGSVGGIAVFLCFQRRAHRKDKLKTRLRWLSWLRNVQGHRKLRKKLQMLLTTKLPYYKEQIARRSSRTAFDAVHSPLI